MGVPCRQPAVTDLRARVVLWAESRYNDPVPPPGARNVVASLVQRACLQGFTVLGHLDRAAEAVEELSAWLAEGRL